MPCESTETEALLRLVADHDERTVGPALRAVRGLDLVVLAVRALARDLDAKARGLRNNAFAPCDAGNAYALDGSPEERHWRWLSRKGHGVSTGNGRAWKVRSAVSGLRREGAAHPLRRQRDELLSRLPDERKTIGGSLAFAAAQERLA